MYWRCQTHVQDSPMEFVVQGQSRDDLERQNYNVCGGPYAEKDEAEFWMYGGPQCKIMLLDLSDKEIKWLSNNRDALSDEEIEWLNSVNLGN